MRKLPFHLILTGTLIAVAVALRVADPAPIERLRLSIFDSYVKISPRAPDPAFPVVIVDVDEASLAKFGQWPWPRSVMAEIVRHLKDAGVAAIGIDLILAEPDRLSPEELSRQLTATPELAPLVRELDRLPSNDVRLGEAIAAAPAVVGFAAAFTGGTKPSKPRAALAIAGDDPRHFIPAFPGATLSLPVITKGARGEGGVNWLPTHDQVVRRVPLLFNIGDVVYPSLSVEVLRVGMGQTTLFIRSSGGSGIEAFGEKTGIDTVRVGTTVLPTDSDGQLWLYFSPHEPRRYVSAYKLLEPGFDPASLKGKHILIGASAIGLLDTRATPLSPNVPGVEIHAQAVEQMLAGDHLYRPALATGAEIVFLIAASLLVATLIRRSGPLMAAAIGAGAIIAVAWGSWIAFSQAGYLFDPVYPSLAVTAVYIGGSLLAYIKTESDRARVRSAFSHYVSAPLVDELALNVDKLKLGGETREITLIFADVRGFSKISETMDAEEVIRFVNRVFTPLSDTILEHKGTIDKFMGDAVMAFWNAPVHDTAHAANACRAALAMIGDLEKLNRDWAEEAAATGETVPLVRVGIGLNTGPCCVGNVGSPQRFDYSILGDAVNVAARLEESTKTYGVPIISGETTARLAPHFAWLEIGAAALRGKERQERLFALVGDESVASGPEFQALVVAHRKLCEAIAVGDARTGADRLAACRAEPFPLITRLFDHYESRLTPAVA